MQSICGHFGMLKADSKTFYVLGFFPAFRFVTGLFPSNQSDFCSVFWHEFSKLLVYYKL